MPCDQCSIGQTSIEADTVNVQQIVRVFSTRQQHRQTAATTFKAQGKWRRSSGTSGRRGEGAQINTASNVGKRQTGQMTTNTHDVIMNDSLVIVERNDR